MKVVLSALGFAAAVAAHGYVDNATIGGQEYIVSLYPIPLPCPPANTF